MSKSLPARPNLEQLKQQAKDLLKSHKAGDPDAIQRFRQKHPKWSTAAETEIRAAKFLLSDAQLVIAREYGFASWPKLKQHVEAILVETENSIELLKKAFQANDAPTFRKLLERYPEIRAKSNEPIGPFD